MKIRRGFVSNSSSSSFLAVSSNHREVADAVLKKVLCTESLPHYVRTILTLEIKRRVSTEDGDKHDESRLNFDIVHRHQQYEYTYDPPYYGDGVDDSSYETLGTTTEYGNVYSDVEDYIFSYTHPERSDKNADMKIGTWIGDDLEVLDPEIEFNPSEEYFQYQEEPYEST